MAIEPRPTPSSEHGNAVERAVVEKAIAVEERIARLRLVAVGLGTVLLAVSPLVEGIRWLAWTVIGVAWVDALAVLRFKPFRRGSGFLATWYTAITDATMAISFVFATGGLQSPFYPVINLSLLAIAFRYSPRIAFPAASIYAAAYVGLAGASGQLVGHGRDVAFHCLYFFVAAALGAAISREIQVQTEARIGQAQAAVRVRDEFMSIAAHELRTPLSALVLYLGGLELFTRRAGAPVADPEVLRRLRMAIRQTDRLSRLVDNLLDVSRVAAGRLDLNREEMNLGEAVRDVADRFAESAAQAGCPLTVMAADGVVGSWDRLRVEQVVTNLLSNAIKYGRGAPVELRVEAQNGEARVAVCDNGIGVGPEDAERIFERFERAASERHYGGLGLGLYIARQIAHAHGGQIRVESLTGAGATFTLTLPCDPIPQ